MPSMPAAIPSPRGNPILTNDRKICSYRAEQIPPRWRPPVPIAKPDYARTLRGVPVVIAVLANDEGSNLSIGGYTLPPAGSLVLNPDQSFTYTPAAGFVGTDGFAYTVRDQLGGTAQGEVTIVVARPNSSRRPPTTPPTSWPAPARPLPCWPTTTIPTAIRSPSSASTRRRTARSRSSPTSRSATRRSLASPASTASPTPSATAPGRSARRT